MRPGVLHHGAAGHRGERAADQCGTGGHVDVRPLQAAHLAAAGAGCHEHAPAEARIADAIGDGASTERSPHAALSVKAVDYHLQNIYRKLGVRNRTHLAGVLTIFDNGADPTPGPPQPTSTNRSPTEIHAA
jgi:DNA-binding CsgD family transcriptional regulator